MPLLRPTIDTILPADPSRADSYAAEAGVLHVRATAAGEGAFTLFDGGVLQVASSPQQMTLSASAGDELNAGVVFEVMAASRPSAVTAAGAALGEASSAAAAAEAAAGAWFFDTASATLHVKLADDYTDAVVSW